MSRHTSANSEHSSMKPMHSSSYNYSYRPVYASLTSAIFANSSSLLWSAHRARVGSSSKTVSPHCDLNYCACSDNTWSSGPRARKSMTPLRHMDRDIPPLNNSDLVITIMTTRVYRHEFERGFPVLWSCKFVSGGEGGV